MALHLEDMWIQNPRVMAVFVESVSMDMICQKILFKYRDCYFPTRDSAEARSVFTRV